MSDISTPQIHEPCSRHFRYLDLIQCGETYHRLASEAAPPEPATFNVPRETPTYQAIATLATTLLDPLTDHFGPITLTYGFASPALTRHIAARPSPRIAPSLDQHAGSELNRRGNLICNRRGQACDFFITDPNGTKIDSRIIARHIATHLPFDRLYLYGADRPLHLSTGPDQTRSIVEMRRGPSGRLIPRAFSAEAWLKR